MQPVLRFAPSPNGHLHLGHAFSALLNARLAGALGGRFLLRIEDIDTIRCTEALVADCQEDLAWLGLRWEAPVLRQSAHLARYRAAAAALEARGLAYPCFCTRAEIIRATPPDASRDPEGAPLYPGTCRALDAETRAARIAAGEPHAIRLDMARALAEAGPAIAWIECDGPRLEARREIAAEPARWGDVILVRKETPTSYHLSVVLDDHLQRVSHVVRGEDLRAATAIHRVLQILLGLKAPLYRHHPLLRDENGRKLAKSALSKPLRAFRDEGVSAAEIRARLGFA